MDKQYRLVPIEPTREMLKAAREAAIDSGAGWVSNTHFVYQFKAAMLAAAPAQESHSEQAMLEVISERDKYHEAADKLANAIAEYFQSDIGEHSSSNCPWVNAFGVIKGAAPVVKESLTVDREAIRNEALEKAAEVCDIQSRSRWNCDRVLQARLDAKEIRALKSQPAQPSASQAEVSDTEMLDWLIENECAVRLMSGGYDVFRVDPGPEDSDWFGADSPDPREAIKAAMQQEGK